MGNGLGLEVKGVARHVLPKQFQQHHSLNRESEDVVRLGEFAGQVKFVRKTEALQSVADCVPFFAAVCVSLCGLSDCHRDLHCEFLRATVSLTKDRPGE